MPLHRATVRRPTHRAAGVAATSEDAKQLREWLSKSAYKSTSGAPIVYLVLRGTASSGMSRTISPIVFTRSGPLHPGPRIAALLGLRFDRAKEGIVIRGVGMDMGFALIDDLAHKIGMPLKHEWL